MKKTFSASGGRAALLTIAMIVITYLTVTK